MEDLETTNDVQGAHKKEAGFDFGQSRPGQCHPASLFGSAPMLLVTPHVALLVLLVNIICGMSAKTHRHDRGRVSNGP
jgi:hypothetical protein